MKPEWKIERLNDQGILRVTMDIKLDQVPMRLMYELNRHIKAGNFAHMGRPLFNKLSMREKEVLHRVIQSQTSKQIADHLNIAENTVKTHRKNIIRKLKCTLTELEGYKVFYTELEGVRV